MSKKPRQTHQENPQHAQAGSLTLDSQVAAGPRQTLLAQPRDVLGIDPGPSESAYVVLRDGVPIINGILDNETMLVFVRGVEVDHVACEGIQSFGMAVGAETFNTCIWIGRYIQAAEKPYTLVYRSEVKLHLCKSARAKDPNIRQALIDRFGGERAIGKKASPGPLYSIKSHCWSALAVGVTWWDQHASGGRREVEIQLTRLA